MAYCNNFVENNTLLRLIKSFEKTISLHFIKKEWINASQCLWEPLPYL